MAAEVGSRTFGARKGHDRKLFETPQDPVSVVLRDAMLEVDRYVEQRPEFYGQGEALEVVAFARDMLMDVLRHLDRTVPK